MRRAALVRSTADASQKNSHSAAIHFRLVQRCMDGIGSWVVVPMLAVDERTVAIWRCGFLEGGIGGLVTSGVDSPMKLE